MPDPSRSGFERAPVDRLLAPGSRFQRHRWVVLAVAVVLELMVILGVYWLDATLHPLEPVGAGIVFISVVAAGLSGLLVGLLTALVGVLASFLLLADFSSAIAGTNAIASAIVWCGAAVITGLTVGYLRRQVDKREVALEQALNRSLLARERMERVLDFSPQFHQSADATEVIQAICDSALEAFGSDGAQLYELQGVSLRLLALAPPSDHLLGLKFTLEDRAEVHEALRGRRPTFWPDVTLMYWKGEGLRLKRELNMVSAILVPVVNLEDTNGVLLITWDHQIQRPTEELLAILQRFADQAGIAWQGALRVEARHQADALRMTLDQVLALAPTFHKTGTSEELSEAICEAALGTFDCAAAAMYRVEGDRLRVLARVPPVKPLAQGLTFPLTGEMPLARELHSRAPTFIPEVSDPSRLVQPWPPEVVRRAGTRSALYVPIRFEEHGPHNLFVLAWDRPRAKPDEGYLVVVQRFADQAALALTNASAQRLYARFEASLLPSEIVEHPGLEVTIRYRSGEQRLRLGGDFVGSLVRPPDRTLHIVIGDVSGHGPDAAALGATLRSTWKALVLAGLPIPAIMKVMDQVLLAERLASAAFATILMASVSFERTGSFLTLANAGHLPPFFITDRVQPMDTPPAPPLGFASPASFATWRFPLPHRWSLFGYTDGLIDIRLEPGSNERYGESRLEERLGAWAGSHPDEAAVDALMSEIESGSGSSFADDVAVLMVSTKDGGPS